MVVTLTYRDGSTKDVAFADFPNERITTNPINDDPVSSTVNNNRRVEVTYTYNNTNLRAYTDPLTVHNRKAPVIEIAGKNIDLDSPDGNKFTYVVPKCGEDNIEIDISLANAEIVVDTDRNPNLIYVNKSLEYGDNPINISVLPDGGTQQNYTLTVKRTFPADQLIQVRWGNTLTVIDNLNSPYDFSSYKWYRNGREVGSGRSWSAGASGEKLNPKDNYYVEAVTDDGKTIRSCDVALAGTTSKAYGILLKNNSAYSNVGIEVVAPEATREMEIAVYNAAGKQVFKQKGNYDFKWNLTDNMQRNVSNGLYIVTAKAKGESGKIYNYSTKFVVKR